MSEEYSGTKRSGIQALYTFTPFKLFSGKEEYNIILVPLLTYYSNSDIAWNKGIYDEFHAHYYKRDSYYKQDLRIIHPVIINSSKFRSNSSSNVEYKHRKLLKNQYTIKEEDASKPFPLILKYSYKALREGYYCKYGIVLLHDSKDCPLARRCKLFKEAKNREGCKYYDGPIPYERLYNVFPHVVRKITESGNEKKIVALIVVKIGSSDRILGKIEFSEKLRMEAFSDATIFYGKVADLLHKDFLWVSYEDGIGFRLNNLNGIVFKFNDSALNDYISYLINNNQEIRDWLCLKMKTYFGTSKSNKINLKKFSLSQNGFIAMRRLEEFIGKLISNKGLNEECNEDDLIRFGSFVFAHTLAHVAIANIIAPMTNSSTSSDFIYYINHPIFGRDPSTSVYVVESIYGGLGYLKTLSEMIRNGDKELLRILEELPNIYTNHERKLNHSLNNLNEIVNNFSGKLDKDLLNEIVDIFNEWKNGPFPNTFPLHLAVRNYLGKNFSLSINKDSDTRQAFKDLISELPLCWDGCNLCVGIDRGCMFGPYDQPFLISRKLIREFILTYKDWLGKSSFTFTNNLYNIFTDLAGLAEDNIKIISPWIGKEIIDELAKVKDEKGIRITVVCLDDEKNKNAIEAGKEKGIEIIPIPTVSEQGLVHSKIMIIDDSIALSGSANFTESGLKKNKEAITVTIDPKDVNKFLEQFNEIVKNYKSKE